MTIATWNLERLKYIRNLSEIISNCESIDADILILTEYDERVDLQNYPFHISTISLAELDSKYYKQTEKRGRWPLKIS